MNFIIRNYKPEDYQMVRDWANSQHWNQGTYDHVAFRVLDNKTFWIGELDEQPIASLSGAQYDENYAFLGLYIVKPQYRGKGYGIQVWNKTLSSLTAKNIALQGVLQQQHNYKKSGFKTDHLTLRKQFYGTNKQHISPFIKKCTDLDLKNFTKYDKTIFSAQRKEFLQKWINLPQSKAVAFVRDDSIQGWGMIRVTFEGYRIGPLFAESYEVAEQILKNLVGSVRQDKLIMIDIPQNNKDALKLIAQYKSEGIFSCARMYTNGEPNKQFYKKVYGVTTLEFG